MFPNDLPGLVVNRAEGALGGEPVVRARPAVRAVFGLVKINPVTVLRVDDQQTRLGIETRRPEVGRATFVGRDQHAVPARLFSGIRNGSALLVDALAPVDGGEGLGQE